MAIRETFMGCAAWDLAWAKPPPASVVRSLEAGSTVIVFEHVVPRAGLSEEMREAALWEGYVTGYGSQGLEGYEASFLLGKPDGTAPAWPHRGALTAASTSTTTIQTILRDGGTFNVNGIVEGEFSNYDVTISDDNIVYPGIEIGYRNGLDEFCREVERKTVGFGPPPVAWRILPGLKLQVGSAWSMRNGGTPSTASTKPFSYFSDLDVQAFGIEGARSIRADVAWNYRFDKSVTDIDVYGDITENTTTYVQAVSTATDTLSPGYNAPDNTALEWVDNIDAAGSGPSNLQDVAYQRRQQATPVFEVSVKPKVNELRPFVAPGDYIIVILPDGIAPLDDDWAYTQEFGRRRGVYMAVDTVTWQVRPGYSVVLRTPSGEFQDVSDWIVPERDPGADSFTTSKLPGERPPQVASALTPLSVRIGDDASILSRQNDVYEHNEAL
jgi:hypothetical protein